MSAENLKVCQACKFWGRLNENGGECRRRTPSTFNETRWPLTYPDDWCGEFRWIPGLAPLDSPPKREGA